MYFSTIFQKIISAILFHFSSIPPIMDWNSCNITKTCSSVFSTGYDTLLIITSITGGISHEIRSF